MHPPEVRAEALALVEAGLNDCEISRRLRIPRTTVRDMRWYRDSPRHRGKHPTAITETCPRCWRPAKPIRFAREDYSALLGFYLGDGCISDLARTQRLRISLDTKYPGIIDAVQALLVRSFPHNPVDVIPYHDGACVNVSIHSRHLACAFPQHGPGKKHERRIELEPWQEAILRAEPWAFIRACIWTDGCAFINRTGPYEYLSYDFANCSADIARLFKRVCEELALRPRISEDARGCFHVRINRRESVALMLARVGLKR
jgi:hypothetical protein